MTEFAWAPGIENDAAIRDELDRRHPERLKLRPTDVEGLRDAFTVVEELWAPTIARARRLPPSTLHERVNGEYSFIETFRHLLFAWDAWLRGVLQVPNGYHEWAIPPEMSVDAGRGTIWSQGAGWSSSEAAPELDPVLDVRAERFARVRDYLADATSDDVQSPGTPPPWSPTEVSILHCLRLVLFEEWWHHQFATRDLAVLEET